MKATAGQMCSGSTLNDPRSCSTSITLPVRSARSYPHSSRLPPAQSISNGAIRPPKSQESFVSVEDVLKEASTLGQDFVFEDEEEGDVWQHEQRLAREPPQDNAEQPKVKAALDPDQTDILSAYSSEQGFREVSVLQLKQQLDVDAERPFVLDVRTAWEYTRGHIPGAVNISLDDLSSKVKAGELDAARQRTVAVVCAAGIRSAQAAVRLHKVFGFQNVVNVKGGTTEWVKSGFEIDV